MLDKKYASMSHNVFENYDRMAIKSNNYYGIPEINATQIVSDKLLRFCDFNQVDNHKDYIAHFYYDDYKFIQAWRNPDKYIEKLKQFKAVICPDFSLYTDFPRALQILSCYRRGWIGAYWQSKGIDVIPSIVWGDRKSYEYCFAGMPKHSTVSISTLGIKKNSNWNGYVDTLFKDGYNEMLRRLKPSNIILYGSMIDGLEGNIIRVPSFYEARRKNIKIKGE